MKRSSKTERLTHVAAWRKSGLSRAAYCRRQGLNYATFMSWCALEPEPPEAGHFIALPAPAVEAGVWRIEFPNGIRLEYQGELSREVLQALRHA